MIPCNDNAAPVRLGGMPALVVGGGVDHGHMITLRRARPSSGTGPKVSTGFATLILHGVQP